VGQDGVLTGILALANAEGVINFSGGFPDPELFPTDVLAGITARLLTAHADVALQYAPSQGIATTIAAVSDHLQQLEGVRPSPGGVMITSGGIDAVTLIAKSMLDPTDVVLVEEPSYLGAVAGFAAFEATLRGVDADDDGLDVDALARLLDGGLRAKLLYTIPDYQNPSGYSLSTARRAQLVELCRRHNVLIVEDVAYRELGFVDGERRPSLWSLAPDHVVQIGTFSKTFFPGVRLGWAAGPPEVVAQLVVAKQNSDQCAGALGQRMVEEFIRGGHFGAQVTRARALYRRRAELTVRALRAHMPSDVTWTEPTGGFFTWLHVPGVDTAALAVAARANDVAFVPGAAFFAERVENEYLRLSFSRVSDANIDEGMRRLAAAITAMRQGDTV
jgi:2-aminoadipate transaminase